jgi:membrane protein YdbS with pleckstrin-like domain
MDKAGTVRHHQIEKEEDLRSIYPLAPRMVVRDNLAWIISIVLVLLFLEYVVSSSKLVSNFNDLYPPDSVSGLDNLNHYLRFAGAVFLLGKLLLDYFRLLFFNYQIFADQLLLSDGVFLRRQRSIFLSKIVDVYVNRNWSDVLFGLAHVGIVVIGEKTNIRIWGLDASDAEGLQQHLLAKIEATTIHHHHSDDKVEDLN